MLVHYQQDPGYIHLKEDKAWSICIICTTLVQKLMGCLRTVEHNDRATENIEVEYVGVYGIASVEPTRVVLNNLLYSLPHLMY